MIPEIVYPALKSVTALGERIYRGNAGDNAVAPYAVWDTITGVPYNNLSGAVSDRYTVSVDVFSRNEQESDTLSETVRNAMETVGQVQNIQSLGRDDAKLWRYTMDVDIFKNR